MLNKYKNSNIQSRKKQNKTKKETNEPSIVGFHLGNEWTMLVYKTMAKCRSSFA